MKPYISSRIIKAPLERVFDTISDVHNYSAAVPSITKVEFLSAQHRGVGTRFRETRKMNGREHSVELEVAEYVENARLRMLSDAGGSTWDTLFSLSRVSGDVELRMQMDVRPHGILARIMNVLIRGMIAKGVDSDMDAVKAYCENANGQT